METHIQVRIENASSDDWRSDLQSQITEANLDSAIVLQHRGNTRTGSVAAADPQVVAAVISGGTTVLAALIPILVNLRRARSKRPAMIVTITFRGTRTSKSLKIATQDDLKNNLDDVLSSIGDLNEISLS